MYVLWSHRFSFAPWFQTMSRLGTGAAIATLLFLGFVLISVCTSSKAALEGAPHVPSWDFRKIEKGLLALRDASREEAPPILRALDVRAKNTRPDIFYNPSLPQMLLKINGFSETRAVASGQKLFLHWEPSHAGGKVRNGPPAPLNWSEEQSCFTVTPFVFPAAQDADAVFFTVSLEGEENGQRQEIPFLIEAVQDNLALAQEEPWLKSLRSAQFWAKDLFLELYGTVEAGASGNAYKIAVEYNEGLQILQARDGDFLVYMSDGWAKAPLEMAAEKPLAQVIKQEQGKLFIRIWDSSGFMSGVISLTPAAPAAIASKVETEFVSPRLRNSAEVSCLLGQRRVVLKPGDWWLKEENRSWYSLKKIGEIDDFVSFKREGELFVVDSLEKNQGRSMLKGRLFDKTRQFAQMVSLPIAEGRTGGVVKQHRADTRKKAIHESTRRAPISLAKRGAEEPTP